MNYFISSLVKNNEEKRQIRETRSKEKYSLKQSRIIRTNYILARSTNSTEKHWYKL